MAERPVRAAEAGIGGAHDDADDDQQDRGPEGHARRASGSGSTGLLRADRPRRDGAEWRGPGHAHSSATSPAPHAVLGSPSEPVTRGRLRRPRLRLRHDPSIPARGRGRARPGRGRVRPVRPGRPPPPAGSPAGSPVAGACPTTPTPQGTPEGWDWRPRRRRSSRRSSTRAGTIACGPTRLMFSFLDDAERPGRRTRPDRRGRAVRPRGGSGDPGRRAAGDLHLGDRATVGVYVVDVDFPTAGVWGAEFTTAVGGRGARDDPARLRRPAGVDRSSRSATRRRGRTRRPSPTSAAT